MNKVFLIIQREYLSRVKKKSFLIMTFLVPSLFLAMIFLVGYLSKKGDDSKKEFKVLDQSGIFQNQLINSSTLNFTYLDGDYAKAKKDIRKDENAYLLYIPSDYSKTGNTEIISEKKPGFAVVDDIETQMETILRNKKLIAAGIDTAVLNSSKAKVSINAKQLTDEGEKDASIGATFIVGFVSAFLIYLSLFIYGAQVMRGVIEEKTNRIIEVIVSSVKPFQLMLGKILGIGAVGLTQFLLWIILSTSLSTLAAGYFSKDDDGKAKIEQVSKGTQGQEMTKVASSNNKIQDLLKAADTINFPYIISTFFFYFLGGYLLYSALFAAVGSAVDNETETQQFMLPITLPLIFTFILGMNVIVNNPDSTLSFWLSIIPFTSPIAMMIRIPFGVPGWQIALSMALLIIGFIFTTWVASRIYRVGILMYGKKVTYKELAKWFSYKE
ncbi:ABC transporter permease [Pedobacter psychrophilus]|uniref:ABC transporter permease n=1 Tax=Pedobacter psychrophilus TaxID=1826909 RepID=A0A179DFA5_9SPHI|nr:ABC transporter permease [Pedobacter psychrophilus]OAQ39648.1 ABC transporter permease [Pedobacter psychrophilus]